jgi:hypothetical protein
MDARDWEVDETWRGTGAEAEDVKKFRVRYIILSHVIVLERKDIYIYDSVLTTRSNIAQRCCFGYWGICFRISMYAWSKLRDAQGEGSG